VDGIWTHRFPTTSPGKRQFPAMAYDRSRGVVVLFGGDNGGGVMLGDTWEWNGTTKQWTQRATTGPAPRTIHAMAYDAACQRVILFGGHTLPGGIVNDVWAWDGAAGTWTQQFPTGTAPTARGNHGMAYDELRQSVVIVGGSDNSGNFADTWELSAPGTTAPVISQQPSSVTAVAGQTVTFSALASVSGGLVGYQWRKDGANLANGPTGHGSTISGAQTSTLSIASVAAADAGVYDVIVRGLCRSLLSSPATLDFTTTAVNKDLQNHSGRTADGIEWLIQGHFSNVDSYYNGPYPNQPNSTFTSFTASPSGPNTLLRWSGGASIPNGGFAHVGFAVPGSSLTTLGVSWISAGKVVGCARQISLGQGHSHGDGVLVFHNLATVCGPQNLYVGRIGLEWFSGAVPLAVLNRAGPRRPLSVSELSTPPFAIAPGGTAEIKGPLPPKGARFAMIRYTVSASPTLAGPGDTVDFVEVALDPPSTRPDETNPSRSAATAPSAR